MPDDGSDLKEADLGKFLNKLAGNFLGDILTGFKYLLSILDTGLLVVATIVVATINLVPTIYGLISQAVNLVTGATLPSTPDDLPGAEWMVITDTFFPLHELCSALGAYYTLKFGLFGIRVTVGVVTFGWKVTISVAQAMKFW